MKNTSQAHHQNIGSGILQEALTVVQCDKRDATHFVIQHNNRLKFLIELKGGIEYLKRTIAPYDKGLILLSLLISFIPKKLLILAKLGFFANVKLHPAIAEHVQGNSRYNILIGSYDTAQKIVLQCFGHPNKDCTFIKVGNKGSREQMEREIHFLKNAQNYKTFAIPTLLGSESIQDGRPFSIMVTKGFNGKKVPLKMTAEIFRITREIAGKSIDINGIPHTFSHGDFAPWNIRKDGSTYTVFDWEHCGIRPIGYDAAYFIIMYEIALNHRNFEQAFKSSTILLKRLAPELKLNFELIKQEFCKTTKTLQF